MFVNESVIHSKYSAIHTGRGNVTTVVDASSPSHSRKTLRPES